jgi:Na+/H+ antiporter NhaD/arsenite permease-like protein
MNITAIFSLLFLLILIFLLTERYHRSVAALFGALLTIVFALNYNLLEMDNIWTTLISFIDFNAVFLVVGVMILAEAVGRSGLFEFIGLWLAKAVGGGFRNIIFLLLVLTIIFSAILSNITSMIILGALSISLSKKFDVDPTQIILYEAVLTNIGGLMLMISSIPNLIVTAKLGIGFIEFATISIPLAIILAIVSFLYIYRKFDLYLSSNDKIELDPWSVVENKTLFVRSFFVFIGVIFFFIFQDFLDIPFGVIGFGGAIAMLVLGGQEPESIFSELDWGVVFFLGSFYVIVGGLERSGVLENFAQIISSFSSSQPGLISILNIWICGLSSSLVDNIPITLTLVPVMERISFLTGVSIKTLGWGIVFGANLGGNLTPIGSPSNIIAIGILRKEGKNVDWGLWMNTCAPLVLIHLIISSIYLALVTVM